jgi:hypothetical protein
MTIRVEVELDHTAGYPAAGDLVYQCLRCGVEVPSFPTSNTRCRCGNLSIDVDGGRLSVDHPSELKLFRIR